MRLLISSVFIAFILSIPLLTVNSNMTNYKHSSSAMYYKTMDHGHDRHNDTQANTPCEDNSYNSCTAHECCMMFVEKNYKNNTLEETIKMIKFLDNSKIPSHQLSDIFRPPII